MHLLKSISREDAESQWMPSATLAIGLIGPLHAFTLVIHPAAVFLVIVAQTFVALSVVTAAYLHFSTKDMLPEAFEEFVARTPLCGHEPRVCCYTAAALMLVVAGVVHYVATFAALALAGLFLVWVYRHAMFGVVKRSTSLVVDTVVGVFTASDRNLNAV